MNGDAGESEPTDSWRTLQYFGLSAQLTWRHGIRPPEPRFLAAVRPQNHPSSSDEVSSAHQLVSTELYPRAGLADLHGDNLRFSSQFPLGHASKTPIPSPPLGYPALHTQPIHLHQHEPHGTSYP